MKYLLLMYQNETSMQNLPKDKAGQLHGAFMAYVEAMNQGGMRSQITVCGRRLKPLPSAPNGKASVLYGPFAETKEQLAGADRRESRMSPAAVIGRHRTRRRYIA